MRLGCIETYIFGSRGFGSRRLLAQCLGSPRPKAICKKVGMQCRLQDTREGEWSMSTNMQ